MINGVGELINDAMLLLPWAELLHHHLRFAVTRFQIFPEASLGANKCLGLYAVRVPNFIHYRIHLPCGGAVPRIVSLPPIRFNRGFGRTGTVTASQTAQGLRPNAKGLACTAGSKEKFLPARWGRYKYHNTWGNGEQCWWSGVLVLSRGQTNCWDTWPWSGTFSRSPRVKERSPVRQYTSRWVNDATEGAKRILPRVGVKLGTSMHPGHGWGGKQRFRTRPRACSVYLTFTPTICNDYHVFLMDIYGVFPRRINCP